MKSFKEITNNLVDALCLEFLPVAVKLEKRGDKMSPKAKQPETILPSFCASLVAAGKGETLLLRAENMRCSDANLMLGLVKKVDGTNDEGRPHLGEVTGVIVTPLSSSESTPDAVLIHLDPEQAGKLLQAASYDLRSDKDGRKRIPTYPVGGELLLCPAYVMARAILDGKAYVGVAGRWSNLNILTDKLVLGMPYALLEKASDNLAKILATPLKRTTRVESS